MVEDVNLRIIDRYQPKAKVDPKKVGNGDSEATAQEQLDYVMAHPDEFTLSAQAKMLTPDGIVKLADDPATTDVVETDALTEPELTGITSFTDDGAEAVTRLCLLADGMTPDTLAAQIRKGLGLEGNQSITGQQVLEWTVKTFENPETRKDLPRATKRLMANAIKEAGGLDQLKDKIALAGKEGGIDSKELDSLIPLKRKNGLRVVPAYNYSAPSVSEQPSDAYIVSVNNPELIATQQTVCFRMPHLTFSNGDVSLIDVLNIPRGDRKKLSREDKNTVRGLGDKELRIRNGTIYLLMNDDTIELSADGKTWTRKNTDGVEIATLSYENGLGVINSEFADVLEFDLDGYWEDLHIQGIPWPKDSFMEEFGQGAAVNGRIDHSVYVQNVQHDYKLFSRYPYLIDRAMYGALPFGVDVLATGSTYTDGQYVDGDYNLRLVHDRPVEENGKDLNWVKKNDKGHWILTPNGLERAKRAGVLETAKRYAREERRECEGMEGAPEDFDEDARVAYWVSCLLLVEKIEGTAGESHISAADMVSMANSPDPKIRSRFDSLYFESLDNPGVTYPEKWKELRKDWKASEKTQGRAEDPNKVKVELSAVWEKVKEKIDAIA